MAKIEELSAAVAALDALLAEDERGLHELREAADGCDPRARLPGPPEELQEPLPRAPAAPRPTPALWSALRG